MSKKAAAHEKFVNTKGLTMDVCPYCHMVVAKGDPETIVTADGVAHTPHAMKRAVNELTKAGIPRPSDFTRRGIWEHICAIVRQLLRLRATRKIEQWLEILHQVASKYFQQPIKINRMVTT